VGLVGRECEGETVGRSPARMGCIEVAVNTCTYPEFGSCTFDVRGNAVGIARVT
jgi:hypothetical protein